jgi:hypothetical protein
VFSPPTFLYGPHGDGGLWWSQSRVHDALLMCVCVASRLRIYGRTVSYVQHVKARWYRNLILCTLLYTVAPNMQSLSHCHWQLDKSVALYVVGAT